MLSVPLHWLYDGSSVTTLVVEFGSPLTIDQDTIFEAYMDASTGARTFRMSAMIKEVVE